MVGRIIGGLVELSNRPEAREFANRVLDLMGAIGENLPILGDFFTVLNLIAGLFGWIDKVLSPVIKRLSRVFGWLEKLAPKPLKPLFSFLQEITEDGLGDMLIKLGLVYAAFRYPERNHVGGFR